MKNAITKQPVSIAVDAGNINFQLYGNSGVARANRTTTEDMLNHGIVAVGFGTTDGEDYWIAKNSWGAGWGD